MVSKIPVLLIALTGCAHFGSKPRPAGQECVRYNISMKQTQLESGQWAGYGFSSFVHRFGDPVYTGHYPDEIKGGAYADCPEPNSENREILPPLTQTIRSLVPAEAMLTADVVAVSPKGSPTVKAAGGRTIRLQEFEVYYRGCPFARMQGKFGDKCWPL